jgi:hypothetical protein
MVTNRIIRKKKLEIYRAVAASVFSIIKFSPKGLTTKNDGFYR